jgi:hypothetical protein
VQPDDGGEDRGETTDLAHLVSPAARRDIPGLGRKPSDAVVFGQNGSAFLRLSGRRSFASGDGSEHLL